MLVSVAYRLGRVGSGRVCSRLGPNEPGVDDDDTTREEGDAAANRFYRSVQSLVVPVFVSWRGRRPWSSLAASNNYNHHHHVGFYSATTMS